MKIGFDFDGTIADTMSALEDLAVAIICPKFMLSEDEVREGYQRSTGDPFEVQLSKIVTGASHYELDSTARQFAHEKLPVTLAAEPFDDVEKAFAALSNADHEIHVVSSTKTDIVETWLELHALDSHVERVWGLDYGYKLTQLVRSDVELFVGDSNLDRVRADARGIRFWGIQRNPKLLEQDNANGFTLDSFLEDL